MLCEKGLDKFAKSIDSGQPAQSAQADLSRNLLLLVSFQQAKETVYFMIAEPQNSVGSVADLRTGGRWFDPRLGQHSFSGLMIGFIPL